MSIRIDQPEKHGKIKLDTSNLPRTRRQSGEPLGLSTQRTYSRFQENMQLNSVDLESNEQLTYAFFRERNHYYSENPFNTYDNLQNQYIGGEAKPGEEFNPDFSSNSVGFNYIDIVTPSNRGAANDGAKSDSKTPNLKYPNTENNTNPLFGTETNSQFGSDEKSISTPVENYRMINSRYAGN
jgi:hypothetical protein